MNKKCINTIELFYKKSWMKRKVFGGANKIIVYTQILCKLKNTFLKKYIFQFKLQAKFKNTFLFKNFGHNYSWQIMTKNNLN
jgi:hypothetical protein